MKPLRILGLFVGLVLAGCTRPTSSTANVQLSFPQSLASSMSTGTVAGSLKHVIIQVTGSGMTATRCVYDANSTPTFMGDCATDSTNTSASAAGGSFSFSVPQGTGRVIQAVAVYNDTADAGMTFYYGDITQDLNADATIAVPITQIATGVINGRVMGRYLTGTDSGPTGSLDIYYQPADTTKPRMYVQSSPMLNGWMNTMMLSGVQLSFVVKDSTGTESALWGGPTSIDSSLFASPGTTMAKAGIPVGLRQTGSVATGPNYETVDPTVYVWGYFGTNASLYSSKTVCVDTSQPFANLKVYNATTSNYPTQAYMTASTTTMPAISALIATSTPLSNVYFNGGMPPASTPCMSVTAATLFLNITNVSTILVDGKGNDAAAGFRVPFIVPPGNNNVVVSVNTADPRVISGQLLPGTAALIPSVNIYRSSDATTSGSYDLDCSTVTASSLDSSGTINGSGAFSVTTNIHATDAAAGTSVVLCPVSSPTFVPGVFIDHFTIQYGTPQPPTAIQAMIDAPKIGTSQCHTIQLNLMAGTSMNVYSPTAQTVTFANSGFANPAAFSVFSDGICGTVTSSTVTIPAGQSSMTISVKGTAVETGTQTITFTDSALATPSAATNFNITSSGTAIQMSAPQMILSAGQCVNVSSYFLDTNTVTAAIATAQTIAVTPTAGLQAVQSCATPTPITSLNVAATDFGVHFGVIAKSTVGTNERVDLTGTVSGSVYFNFVTTVTSSLIQRANTGGTVRVTGSLVSGLCEPIVVHRQNSVGADVLHEPPLNFNVTSSNPNALLYADSGCTMSSGTNLTTGFGANAGTTTIYVRELGNAIASASDSTNLTLTVPNATGSQTNQSIFKPIFTADNPTINSSSCTGTTFSLHRAIEGDAIPANMITLSGTTWTDSTPTPLGSYATATYCTAGSPTTTTGSMSGTSVLIYLKNTTATTGTGTITFTPSTPDYQYLGTTPLTATLSLVYP